ncbi:MULTISPECIES: hypothetical protein [Proteus]|uniref:hypothetical protein n=1 Tax=Proteus TaxID=583 RepID=UPI00053112F1|nr:MULTISPECIES: hypothetical protein [Proteus]EIT1739999.1 hypothetical protein [Proteus mirabilis]EJG2210197.1 hypothetical protein [Proteus mirabilis]EKX2216314.1 hypothetical protein [Proteus mirabilis]EKX4941189.1 hypothetical protein [Proteus mirabilis]EKX6258142.1 hypothetical protein [Proteus mirabilis]
MIRKPDYERGRFFISPILGCNAQCYFCYIYNKGYKTKAVKNGFDISQVLQYLYSHSNFKLGKNGSIISIGAWGDPFPRYNKKLCLYSLHWLKKLSSLGNPIQIMSRYELHSEILDEIVKANKYAGHILYSTSISSIKNFRSIEPYSDSPQNRLKSLKLLKRSGIATNVMVKPFILGITNLESIEIATALKEYEVEQCVVGELLLDNRIKKEFSTIGLPIIIKNEESQILDCTSGENYELSTSIEFIVFSKTLSDLGIKVFRKSSCVNSYILNTPNPANYMQSDPNHYCIKCGVCK